MEMSFCKLRAKEVINICDGKNLGNITDIIFDTSCGRILGLIIPAQKSFFSFFKSNNDIFIPYNRICKIGKDIILVDIIMQQNCNCETLSCNNNFNCETQNNKNINIQSMLDDINNSK
ncbi:MAG: YlmC/YmxH family sporulation protein [Christensenellales bacterium]